LPLVCGREAGIIRAMNVKALGIDTVECQRIAELIDRHGRRFLDRVFTPAEQAYCLPRKRHVEHLAGRFAAKEAVLKALGTGWRDGIAWTDIEVVNNADGAPRVRLAGRCRQIADQDGYAGILISISHTSYQAVAVALAQSAGGAVGIGD